LHRINLATLVSQEVYSPIEIDDRCPHFFHSLRPPLSGTALAAGQ
jgi:hypothetical protein